MYTVIYAHPNPASYNGAVYSAVRNELESKNKKSAFIDLYGENFSPVLTREEHADIGTDGQKNERIKRYQDILMSTERLVLIFPLWWNAPPAMIKGFFDRICVREFAFTQTPRGIHGKLHHIKSALVLTTSNAPTFALKLFMGNAVKKYFIGSILKGIGIRDCTWLNCGNITSATVAARQASLRRAVAMLYNHRDG